MRRRVVSQRKLWGAGALSAALHLAGVAVWIGFAGRFDALPSWLEPTPVGVAALDEESAEGERTYIDLQATTVDPPSTSPDPVAAVGDETRLEAGAAPRGTTRDPRPAASDDGVGSGRALPMAFRRDRSNLHVRLKDGAQVYQPSHERTSSRVSSPQAIRQEPVVGIGDSARSRRPSGVEEVPSPDLPVVAGQAEEREDAPVARDPLRPNTGDDVARGVGPLDAERGQRRFDVLARGVSRDDHRTRAASNESQPGLMDLSVAAAVGASESHRGPGHGPGAVSRASSGPNPAVTGTTQAGARGSAHDAAEAERQYARYELMVRERVRRLLQFPKRLALELQQGESIVAFEVRPDGRLGGAVLVTKSAGFDEFDAEAVRVVTAAAPFPPPGRAMTIRLRVPFENPLVR